GSSLLELMNLFTRGSLTDRLWLAYYDLLFSQRSNPPVFDYIQNLESRYRQRIEAPLRRMLPAEATEDAIEFTLRHLDGLALWSMFVPNEDALAIPENAATLMSSVLALDVP